MSKTVSEVQSAVTPEIRLVVNKEDAAGNVVATTWRLVLDYRALAIIEKETGRDLKAFSAWKDLKSSEYPVFVYASLHRYHPDVTREEVENSLNPASQIPLSNAFFDMCFPGVVDAIKKQEESGATAVPNEAATASA